MPMGRRRPRRRRRTWKRSGTRSGRPICLRWRWSASSQGEGGTLSDFRSASGAAVAGGGGGADVERESWAGLPYPAADDGTGKKGDSGAGARVFLNGFWGERVREDSFLEQVSNTN